LFIRFEIIVGDDVECDGDNFIRDRTNKEEFFWTGERCALAYTGLGEIQRNH